MIGSVQVPTTLCGTVYNLLYVIGCEEHLTSKILIGDPLLDETRVTLTTEVPLIEPLIGDGYIMLIADELQRTNILTEINEKIEEIFPYQICTYHTNHNSY